MNGKIICALAVLACVSMQLAHALKCQTCSDANSCKKPTIIECDGLAANFTRDVIYRYYYDVQELNTKNFSCFMSRYKTQNVVSFDVRGCIMTGTVNCQSLLIDQTSVKDKCIVCNKDNCNSVGTYSSSIVTMISAIILTKLFVV